MNDEKKPGKTNMTVSIDTDYYEFLKKLSYNISVKENKKIGISELVRRALDAHWPIPTEEMILIDLKKYKYKETIECIECLNRVDEIELKNDPS